MIHFDQFVNQLVVQGKIRLITPLHIGAGQNDLYSVDMSVVKDHLNRPYIPGSSLKGTLRSYLERLAQSGILEYENYPSPCVYGERMCLEELRSKDARMQKTKELQELNKHLDDYIIEQSCPICQLFGNQLRAAKVIIYDALILSETPEYYITRNGNGINRDTLKVHHRALYDFEAVNGGLTFQFHLQADNLTSLEEKWLITVLEVFRQGRITLGGKVARGLGKVTGEEWNVQRMNRSNFLNHLFDDHKAGVVPYEDYIQSIFN